jgi:hypothetical protein
MGVHAMRFVALVSVAFGFMLLALFGPNEDTPFPLGAAMILGFAAVQLQLVIFHARRLKFVPHEHPAKDTIAMHTRRMYQHIQWMSGSFFLAVAACLIPSEAIPTGTTTLAFVAVLAFSLGHAELSARHRREASEFARKQRLLDERRETDPYLQTPRLRRASEHRLRIVGP